MSTFKQIRSNNDLKEMIKSAFDTDLKVNGAWGYTQELATIIEKTDFPTIQLEHTLASMRTYIEMNMTQEKEKRYGSINLNEISRENFNDNGLNYHKVNYEITAIKDNDYAAFISEYKENYGKEDFDLNEHFKKRKESTLTREVIYWFEISDIK